MNGMLNPLSNTATLLLQLHQHRQGEKSFQVSASLVFAAEGGALQEWASQKGLPSDLPSICRNDEARKWVLDQLNVTAKESKLKVGWLTQVFMEQTAGKGLPDCFEGGCGGGGEKGKIKAKQ